MKKFLISSAIFIVILSAAVMLFARSTDPANQEKNRIVGEVKAIDSGARRLTIRTDGGKTVIVLTDEATTYRRVPPNERSLEKAVAISFSDISMGDRILVIASTPGDVQVSAGRLFVMNKAELAGEREREREEWRRRGIFGVVIAIDSGRKEIAARARGREGPEPVVISTAGNVRFRRFAADSARLSDSRPSSFAELKVGNQFRALGDRSADGTRFTAEEIVFGSFFRTGGRITAIDTGTGELTIKDDQTGKQLTIAIGRRSMMRRIPADIAEKLETGRQASSTATNSSKQKPGPAAKTATAEAEKPPRSLQETFESLPSITLDDLKKGDMVLVTATTGNERSRATAVTLVTGDPAFLTRLERLQTQTAGSMNPGLPGDVLGGGVGDHERP